MQNPCVKSKHASAVCLCFFKLFGHAANTSFNLQFFLKKASKTSVFLSSPFLCLSPFSAALHVRTVRTVGKGSSSSAGGPVNETVVRSAEEKTAEYAVFALVPVFCVMGLLGILICNILKKKGYRCTAEKEGGDEEFATPHKEGERDDRNCSKRKKVL